MAYVQSTELWIKMQLLSQAPGCTLIFIYIPVCMYISIFIYYSPNDIFNLNIKTNRPENNCFIPWYPFICISFAGLS